MTTHPSIDPSVPPSGTGCVECLDVNGWWFHLRRCASCGRSISARYPLIEALTGVLSALVAWRLGFGWATLAALVLTWFLIALTFIDIDHQLLPDSLTLPLITELKLDQVGWAGSSCGVSE